MIDIMQARTRDDILQRLLQAVPSQYNKRPGGLIHTSLSAVAWALEGLYLRIGLLDQQSYTATATGEALSKLTAQQGVTRKGATRTIAKGVYNIMPPIGARFVATDSPQRIYYTVQSIQDEPVQSGEYAGLYSGDLLCDEYGPNDYTGRITALSFLPGLTRAEIIDIISPGTHAESDESLRERWQATLLLPAFGGNIASYIRYCQEHVDDNGNNDIGAVQVWPNASRAHTTPQAGYVVLCILNRNYIRASDELIYRLQQDIMPTIGGDTPPVGLGVASIGATVAVYSGTPCAIDIQIVGLETTPPTTEGEESSVTPIITPVISSYLDSLTRTQWGKLDISATVGYTIKIAYIELAAKINNIPSLSIQGIKIKLSTQTEWTYLHDLYVPQSYMVSQYPVVGAITYSEA